MDPFSPEKTKKIWAIMALSLATFLLAVIFIFAYKLGQRSIEIKIPKELKPTTQEQRGQLENTPVDPFEVFARKGEVVNIDPSKKTIKIKAEFRPAADKLATQDILVKTQSNTKFIKIEGGKELEAGFSDIKQGDKIIASSLSNIKNLPEFTAAEIKILR